MKASTAVRGVGIALCVAAFFMPAVYFPPDANSWGPTSSYKEDGYLCALVTLWAAGMGVLHPGIKSLPILLVGGVNPLLLFYAGFSSVRTAAWVLPTLAAAIVAGWITIWILLAHATLLVGHYCWIAGIALVLISPLIDAAPGFGRWLRAS